MQPIVSPLNTGLRHGMLPHQPSITQLRRTTLNRKKIRSTAKALSHTRRASEGLARQSAANESKGPTTSSFFAISMLTRYHTNGINAFVRFL